MLLFDISPLLLILPIQFVQQKEDEEEDPHSTTSNIIVALHSIRINDRDSHQTQRFCTQEKRNHAPASSTFSSYIYTLAVVRFEKMQPMGSHYFRSNLLLGCMEEKAMSAAKLHLDKQCYLKSKNNPAPFSKILKAVFFCLLQWNQDQQVFLAQEEYLFKGKTCIKMSAFFNVPIKYAQSIVLNTYLHHLLSCATKVHRVRESGLSK